MRSNLRRAFLVIVFSAIAGAGSLAWAYHGYGGGRWGGFSGGHGHVSFGNFGGYSGFNNHWGGSRWGGSGVRYYSDYRNFGWRYGYFRPSYFRPYAYGYFGYPYLGYGGYPGSYYYGYPSYDFGYPGDYYANDNVNFNFDVSPTREYVVSRPVSDAAQVQFRLPDPQATIWVQGQEIASSGNVRQFRSPQLDPSQQYTYTVKAEWNDNGKRVADERRVKVQANALAVVDFTKPAQAAPEANRPALPDLPPPQSRPANE